uniref:Methylenetetrahydrofolate reductase (NAD(P)H) n=1 Tax=Pyramimonas obovata TaxID=1411642 RepID=A0A7S0RVB9_9CHLO|mmetsp:Transcript_7755/g.15842  ORF Transcript_7755/g.15842 Transcript_7755/m.15842 type:complete len:371 (+) Transcript_7755:68-1180(+)|eukprot:CAMPEP_0118937544 /NCGR_PEP_ID=MMETSP1169-20130426/23088_1 /TAXON_ID=36882 /ORGANISM="Pyramimonas obovata, Strain CCMP722" /LENGTH=370 /DNA_ID=CAMNT_0006881213 /DNA_START=60 /DNA_END=1172 /DNA_ORIENTATION=-
MASLRDALLERERPVFLFGTVPAMEGTPTEKIRAQCVKFAAKMRELATDGYIVYDIQEEKGRTPDPRPFPFRRMSDPVEYADMLKQESGKDSVVYKCVAEHTGESFGDWSNKTSKVHGVELLNLVGGATSTVTYSGPTMEQAAEVVHKHNMVFGGVTIAERHMKKKNEHTTLAAKVKMGAQWFITQAIYNPEPTIEVINEYGALCKKEGVEPKKLILTFAPCGRPKTMTFMHWLGVSVPEETEKAILEAPVPVEASVNLLCDMLTKIMKDTASAGVPLGISIEHVSIFKEEVKASFDLFNRTQAILLDNRGIPFAIKWTSLPQVTSVIAAQKESKAVAKKGDGVTWPALFLAFAVGIMFGKGNVAEPQLA